MKYSKFLFCLAILTVLVSCNNAQTTSNDEATSQNRHNVRPQDIDFKLVVEKPDDPQFDEIYELVKKEDILQKFINEMNARIEFPGEVTIKVTQCGENNAFYNSEDSTISICYEFLEHTIAMQDEAKISKREKLLNATAFTFLHEMGHAIVDRLKIPITGKEENAVDELAMIVLMSDTSDVTYYAAIEGAMQFYSDALDEDLKNFPYYDTHAPSIERYYDMLAIIVGAYPTLEKDFVGENDETKLHPDRAESAEADYERKLFNWKTLLGKAWKE